MDLVEENHPIYVETISDADLAANPGLVKSKNVRPPTGSGSIRLVCIGENASVDSQPCGGTHVTETKEVGDIHIGKIEKKGRENRRFRIRFGPLPSELSRNGRCRRFASRPPSCAVESSPVLYSLRRHSARPT
jgi:misacylated tRNA(Ala) deacylase